MLMVAPVVAGAGISTLGQLAGGLISGKQTNKQANKAYKRQKEFAKNAVQWKAEDARKAGLHPLFAMGAGTASYSPQFISGQDPMGTAISDSAQQLGQAYAQSKAPPPGTPAGEIGRAQLRAVNASAQRDEAAAIRDLSAAKRMEGASNATQDGNLYSGGNSLVDESRGVRPGMVAPKGAEVISASKKDRSRTAGKSPAFKRYVYGTDSAGRAKTIDIPYSDEGPLEEFGPGKAIATLLKNLGWLDDRPPKFVPIKRKRKATRRARRRSRYNR